MFRRIVICLIALFAGMSAADARPRRQIDATPFSHAPCSVLDNRPCTPYYCSVFDRGPCIPEIDYPYGENLQLTIETVPPQDQAAKYQKPDHDLDTIGDLFAALRSCWSPPPADSAREGMQMSVRFSFRRSGEIIAAPRLTYSTAGVSADTRAAYLKAINASLDACMPLRFTGGLGGALAGRPIAIRYVDNRELGKPSGTP
jgi:head-tail adaptor